MTKKLIALNVFAAALLVGGGLLLGADIRQHDVNIVSTSRAQAAARPSVHAAPDYISGKPTGIRIPSLHINVPVVPGDYNAATGGWTLTSNSAQYATMTAPPNNQSGDTFLYGHAIPSVFGALPHIRASAVAIVTTNNGHTFYYTLNRTRVVSPTDTAVVTNRSTGRPTLTLQTCVGLFSQNRELMTFSLERAV